jgi:hypothetical protein
MKNLDKEILADPENALQIALRPIQNWEREKELLKIELVENIQTQLSPLQMERWPSLDRAMRREKDLPKGQIPGESMNIFVVLHGMELSQADIQAIDPALLEYEVKLDRALEERSRTLKQHQKRIQDAMLEKNMGAGLSALRKISESRAMVCAMHFEALDEISVNLSAETATEFKETVLANGFPEVYEDTIVDKVLKTIRSLKTLEQEQITLVDAIESRYLVSLEESNMRMIEGYRIDGKQIPIIEAERAIARRNKENTRLARLPESILNLSREREEMLERYRQELLDVLSTIQQNSVRTQTRGGRPNASVKGGKGGSGKNPKGDNATNQGKGFRSNTPEDKQVPAPPRKDDRSLPAGNNPR